jgi:hypothetical protein
MKAGNRRPLTAGERALAYGVFGDRLPLDGLRVLQAPPLPFLAMVPLGKTILFSRWRAALDFSAADSGEQGWFIHELAHCWQARRGVPLVFAKLRALGVRAYRYAAAPEKHFDDYNIEQQAEIVRHLFLARLGVAESGAPSRATLERLWAEAQ